MRTQALASRLVAAGIGMAAMVLLCQSVSQAAELPNEQEYDVPAGLLSAALIEIGRVSGAIVSFRPELVSTRSTGPIQGRFSLREALEQALLDTDLSVDIKADGTVTVQPPAPSPSPSPPATGESVTLPTVQVRASADTGLLGVSASTATRTETVLSALPLAVSVVTREALDLQNAQTSTDGLLYVPGCDGTDQGCHVGHGAVVDDPGLPGPAPDLRHAHAPR